MAFRLVLLCRALCAVHGGAAQDEGLALSLGFLVGSAGTDAASSCSHPCAYLLSPTPGKAVLAARCTVTAVPVEQQIPYLSGADR